MKWLGYALLGMIAFVPLSVVAKNTPPAATSESVHKLKVINIMPAFWKFEAQAKHMSSQAERIATFRRLVINPYKIYRIHEFKKDVTNAGIARYLKWVQPHLAQMRTLATHSQAEVRPALENFMKTFPDFNAHGITIFILPSFHHFVGQTHGLENGHAYVMFGPDRLASMMGDNVHLAVIMSHELFHAYHRQVNPDIFNKTHELYARMWVEGLATCASAKLNPEIPAATVLAHTTLGNDSPDLVPRAARAFLPAFSSSSRSIASKFFLAEYKGDFPRFTGYLLGYKVCQRIGRHYTLRQMAHLGGKRLKRMIHSTLETLAHETPPRHRSKRFSE